LIANNNFELHAGVARVVELFDAASRRRIPSDRAWIECVQKSVVS
jgi:hypothetical protein